MKNYILKLFLAANIIMGSTAALAYQENPGNPKDYTTKRYSVDGIITSTYTDTIPKNTRCHMDLYIHLHRYVHGVPPVNFSLLMQFILRIPGKTIQVIEDPNLQFSSSQYNPYHSIYFHGRELKLYTFFLFSDKNTVFTTKAKIKAKFEVITIPDSRGFHQIALIRYIDEYKRKITCANPKYPLIKH